MDRENQIRKIICMAFFLILCGFWLSGVVIEDKIYSAWEKRMLTQKPKFELSAVLNGTYESKYEEWLTDQFPGRDWWVNGKTRCEILLGKKEINGIYLGQDGYLFSESQATAEWDVLEEKMIKEFGQENVSRIHVPNAGAVYSEKMPVGIYFQQNKDAVFENLDKHKEESIYFRTDHHWTMLGAYYAYEAWMKEKNRNPISIKDLKSYTLKDDFLGTHYGKIHYAKQKDRMEFYDPGTNCTVVYDLGSSNIEGLYQKKFLNTEDAYRFFLDGNHSVVQIVTESEQEGGHLAVLKDSFANNFVPFLTLHYKKITVIDPRYFRLDISEWLAKQDVDEILILAQDDTTINYTK